MTDQEVVRAANEILDKEHPNHPARFTEVGKSILCPYHDDGQHPNMYLIENSEIAGRYTMTCSHVGCELQKNSKQISDKGVQNKKPKKPDFPKNSWADKANHLAYKICKGEIPFSHIAKVYINQWGLPEKYLIYDNGTMVNRMAEEGTSEANLALYKYTTTEGMSLTRGRLGYPYKVPDEDGKPFIMCIKWVALPQVVGGQIDKKYKYHTTGLAGRPMPFFIIDDKTLEADVKVFCAGEKDTFTMRNAGVIGAVGLPGEGYSAERIIGLADGKTIICCFDADPPGLAGNKKFCQKAADILGRPVAYIPLPKAGEWGKDVSDMRRRMPTQELFNMWLKEQYDKRVLVEPDWDYSTKQKILEKLAEKKTKVALVKRNVTQEVKDILSYRGKFYHDVYGSTYWFDSEGHVLYKIKDNDLSTLLSRYGLNRTESVYDFLVEDLRVHALVNGELVKVERSFTQRGKVIDVYANNGLIWRISGEGVNSVDNGTDGVLFIHDDTVAPITYKAPSEQDWKEIFSLPSFKPMGSWTPGFQREMLETYVKLMACGRRALLEAPFLNFIGDMASGKTTILRIIGWLWWGERWDVTPAGTDEKNFWVQVDKCGFLGWDNADRYVKWIEDAIACHSTGGPQKLRELFTTADVHEIEVLSFLGITSRTPHHRRPDVADRAICLYIDKPTKKMEPTALRDYVLERRLGTLHYLFEWLSKGLKEDSNE